MAQSEGYLTSCPRPLDQRILRLSRCGVCSSDVHTLTQGWGESMLSLIMGHEIISTVTYVRDEVPEF
ncbi:hypothetical protein BD414DRAFT_411945 [Trametes punicea]|nr:hypothetical protein BD414DRAFT_411945 [Trametes punicea]